MIETDPHHRTDARRSVIRSAFIWTPIFIVSSALGVTFALIAIDDSPSAWISFAITALATLLSGVSALGALRDLYASPVDTTGIIQRKWRKSDIIVFRGHYILIKKRVFRIPRPIFEAMPEAGSAITIQHLPHTNAVIRWERSAAPEPEPTVHEDAAPLDINHSDPILPEPDLPPTISPPPMPTPAEPSPRVKPPSFGSAGRPPVPPPTHVEPPRFGSAETPPADRDRTE